MRIKLLKLFGYKNLEDVEIDFSKTDGRALIVGTNGSGKSNLLEAFSSIFSALYNREDNVSPDFRFELKYSIDDRTLVSVKNVDGVIELSCCLLPEETEYHVVDKTEYDRYLPDHVIAVYCGEEQRLWDNYYFKAYDMYNRQYMDGKMPFRPQQMIYLNHYYWDLIASILSIHGIEEYRQFVSDTIGINSIQAIHMEFDVPKLKRNRNERAKHILEILNPQMLPEINISLDTYIHVRDFCGYEPDMFYNLVVLTLYKDYKIITNLTLKCDDGIEIKDLSEGEKKLLLIYGAINLLSGNNLFLFDEPDAHLHEGRKKEIFDLIKQDEGSHFLISSHSPTLTKMFTAANVILMDNDNNTCRIHYGEVANTISKLTNGEWTYIDQVLFFEKARPLILVEGPGDVCYIQKAISVLSINNNKYDILKSADIIHCGGASNIQRTIDELKENLPEGKTVIALYDRDETGGLEMKNAIKKGKDRSDNNTYKVGSVYYLKLPKTQNYSATDFVIEDYFSKEFKKSVAQAFLDNAGDDFNSLPKDLKQKVKDKLASDLDSYDEKTLTGFSILLDKLCDIVNGHEQVVEVNTANILISV